MKKLIVLMFACFAIGLNLSAQTTLTFDDNAYLSADQHPFIITNNVSEGPAGMDQVWDFSNLTPAGKMTSYMFASKGYENSYLYPDANMVLKENDMSYFYKVTPAGMEEYGNSTGKFSVIYDQPIVKFPFPFSYGSSCTGTYSGKISGSVTGDIKGTYSSTADGYGTLILPGNIRINDVLRVKSVRTNDNSPSSTITFRWYAKNSDPVLRYPLLSITLSEAKGVTKPYKVAYYANAAQLVPAQSSSSSSKEEFVSEQANTYDLKISPNPFMDKTAISYTLPAEAKATLEIFDSQGKLVEKLNDAKQTTGSYSYTFEGNGQLVYFVRLSVDKKVVCTRKIVQLK
jgi:hypothetical protein